MIRTADGETFAAVNVSNDVGGVCAEAACRQLMSDRFPDMAVVATTERSIRPVMTP